MDAAVAELPSGTVTLIFTEVDRSTELVKALGERYGEVLSDHRRLLRAAFAEFAGSEVDTQGDAFFVAFPRARDALAGGRRRTTDDEAVPGLDIRDLGEHRLKDFERPERLFQLVVEGLPSDFPPLRSAALQMPLTGTVTVAFTDLRQAGSPPARALAGGLRRASRHLSAARPASVRRGRRAGGPGGLRLGHGGLFRRRALRLVPR